MTSRPTAEANPTEETLLAEARAGRHQAFEALYRMHHRRVYGTALRMMRDGPRAAEVTQESFVQAWLKLRSFRGEGSFAGWLTGITVRVALRALRTDRRRSLAGDRFAAESAYLAELRRSMPESRIDLERAVASVPERARATLLLSLAGYSQEEIARELKVAVGTVKAQLHRAKRLVVEAMER